MITVIHLPNWAPAKQTGKPWLMCIAGRAVKAFCDKESAEFAADKLARITSATRGIDQ